MLSDAELLQEFCDRQTQSSFAELVRRNVDLVYSAALRQLNGDAHLARDVSQQVFIDLSRKAQQLTARESIAGWLYKSVHHAAANAVRTERRRRLRELKAATMQQMEEDEHHPPSWERLRPVLDEAMLELDDLDRDALLRRFFSGQSFPTIGEAMDLSQDGARKRVDRALDRLHGLLSRRGITSSASALGLVLSQHAVTAAPVGFSAVVAQGVFGAGGLLGAGSLLLMNKFTVGIAAALVAGLVTFVAIERRSLAQSKDELALKQRELAALRSELSQQENRRAARKADIRSSDAAQAVEAALSTLAHETPATATERIQLDSTHAGLFRRLRLGPEKLSALKELIVLRQRTDREVRDALRERGVSSQEIKWDDLYALRLIAARDVDAKIADLFGEDIMAYVRQYERTQPQRAPVRDLESMLLMIGEPLSPETSDALVTWAADHVEPGEAVLPDNIGTYAAPFLTPTQLEKLEVVRASRAALARLWAANSTAAREGKLGNLIPSSQRELAEWEAKYGTAASTTNSSQ